MSPQPLMMNLRQVVRAISFVSFLFVFLARPASTAFAQGGDFTLTVFSQLSPPAVDPGGSSIATLDLEGTSDSVSFTAIPCTVTPIPTTGAVPTCAVSPGSATPPAKPSVTISTSASTPAGLYAITVTGSDSSTSQAVALTLSVEDVSENYTLSVSSTTATPSPVAAGSSATTTVTVHPIASYAGQVTLACLSIAPVTTPSPVCSFNPPTVTVAADTVPPISILTITTSGPTTELRRRPILYALWLGISGLVWVGAGVTGKLEKKFLGICLLIAAANGLFFLPACSTTTSTNNNGVTPSNTYTFTLTAVDANGNAPSTTTPTTVTLAVD